MSIDRRLKEWAPFILILFLFVIVRMSLVSCSSWVYLLEESKQASLGLDLLRGKLMLPFWCYMDAPHAGGSILTALTLTPFFLVFGKKYLALKISALIYSLATLIISCLILKRYYSFKKVFYPFLIFFVLSTPHYLQKSLALFGNTVEFLLAAFLFIWLINRVVIEGKESRFSYLALGLISGLGIWIQLTFLVFIVTFIVFWISQKGFSIFRYKFWQFLAGFCLGLLPWLIYNILYGFPSIYADNRVTYFCENIKELFFIDKSKFFNLLLTDIPRSLHFLPLGAVSSKVLAYLFYTLFWASFLCILLLRRAERGKRSFHLFWILLFLFSIFCFSVLPFPTGNIGSSWGSLNYHFEFYILFLQPVMFIIMAMAYAELGKMRFGVLTRLGFYLLLPVMLLQFFSILDCRVASVKLAMDLSGQDARSNAYESGSNFSLSYPIWEKVLSEIKSQDYRDNYLKGSARSLSLFSARRCAKHLSSAELSERERVLFQEYLQKNLFLRRHGY